MSSLGARGGTIITKLVGVRLDLETRRRAIVKAATVVAKRKGLLALTWPDVLSECEIVTSISTAKRIFESIVALRRAVAESARLAGDKTLTEQALRHGILN